MSGLFTLLIFMQGVFFAPAWASSLDQWLFYEQKRMDTGVDPLKIVSPDLSPLPSQYRPESGRYFLLPSLWIPEGEWQAFSSSSLPASVKSDIERMDGDKKAFRLFVHPLSQKLYEPLIQKYGLLYEHEATPTSSARTLLVFPKNSKEPYFAKVSLDTVLAQSKRTIPSAEVIRSVGISDYVSQQSHLHSSFSLIPDAYGIVPSDMSRKGQLVRPIPSEVIANQSLPIPLFSIYSKDESGQTLFEKWVHQTGLSPAEVAKQFITEPFARAWTQWAVSGLSHEAHAQNVLLEVNPKTGTPTGRFFLRDAGGLFLNPKAHSVTPDAISSLPAPNGFFWDYQKWADTAESNSLNIYFVGGFLFNLEKELNRLDRSYKSGALEKSFYDQIKQELFEKTGLPLEHSHEAALKYHMPLVLSQARESKNGSPAPSLSRQLGRPLRLGFYSGTFDPPHQGHLDILEAAISEKGLDMIIIAPNFRSPYKPEASSYQDRKKMSEILFNRPKMTLVWDDFEHASKTYGSDGILKMMLQHYEPEAQIFRIVGDDSFDWFRESGEGLTDPRVTYLVSQRDSTKGSVFPISIRESPVEVLEFRGHGLSSSLMKEQLKAGKKHPALSDSIHDYIESRGLYRCEKNFRRLLKIPTPR